jgi:ectoine hydroxylase-related dioxygenase (phytanoyl-CoA dioxygenase family)
VGDVRAVTDAERAAFAADGVVCLRGALDPAVVIAMAEPVERALRSDATAELSALATSPSGRFAAGVDHWREHVEFRAFACAGDLPGVVASLLGSTALWLYEDSILVKEPGTDVATRWHQDLGYFHVDGTQLATTWCPLDTVTPESGAVRYARGSHRWDATYRPTLFVTDEPIPGTDGARVPDVDALANAGECEVVTFATRPGDVVVHHARTLHAAGANRSATTRRRAISVRYCGDDVTTRLRPGAPRKPHQERWLDGIPFADLDASDHPQAWPAAGVPPVPLA